MRAVALVLVCLLLIPGLLAAQSTSPSSPSSSSGGSSSNGGTSSDSSTSGAAKSSTPQPVPYSPDEFPLWLRQLRRAEIITIGAFPIALLLSSLGYQTYRYAQHGYSQAYAPTIFGTNTTPLSDQEKTGIILGAVGLSLSVALADFIVGQLTKPPNSGTKP